MKRAHYLSNVATALKFLEEHSVSRVSNDSNYLFQMKFVIALSTAFETGVKVALHYKNLF